MHSTIHIILYSLTANDIWQLLTASSTLRIRSCNVPCTSLDCSWCTWRCSFGLFRVDIVHIALFCSRSDQVQHAGPEWSLQRQRHQWVPSPAAAERPCACAWTEVANPCWERSKWWTHWAHWCRSYCKILPWAIFWSSACTCTFATSDQRYRPHLLWHYNLGSWMVFCLNADRQSLAGYACCWATQQLSLSWGSTIQAWHGLQMQTSMTVLHDAWLQWTQLESLFCFSGPFREWSSFCHTVDLPAEDYRKSYQQWHFFQNLLVLAWDLRQHVRLGSVLWVDQLPFQYITGDDTRMMSSSHRASKALYHTSLAYLVCTVSVMPGDVVQHKSLDNPCSKTLLSSSIISQILIGNTAFMICPVVYDISP